jgi:predicted molibdopterin-dependent oxidoreductase YjgC
VAGLATTLGSGAMTNSIRDACTGDVILVAGSNTTEAHPVIGLEMKAAVRQRGAQLILVDPREIELAKYAALHLRHRPGTDTAVFNAMARVILDEGLENRSFIEERTENLEALREALGAFTLEWAEAVSGVPAEDIRAAAHMYARAKAAAIFWAMGITIHARIRQYSPFSLACSLEPQPPGASSTCAAGQRRAHIWLCPTSTLAITRGPMHPCARSSPLRGAPRTFLKHRV